jgi:hypothetical protein
VVRSLRDTRRMQSRAVTMRDYDYHRSRADLEAQAAVDKGDHDVAGHFEFPTGDEVAGIDVGQGLEAGRGLDGYARWGTGPSSRESTGSLHLHLHPPPLAQAGRRGRELRSTGENRDLGPRSCAGERACSAEREAWREQRLYL